MIVNLYEFLEIEPNASLEEVLAAIAKAEANGKNPKLILASKNLLCDAQRRNQYNESLKKHLAANGIFIEIEPQVSIDPIQNDVKRVPTKKQKTIKVKNEEIFEPSIKLSKNSRWHVSIVIFFVISALMFLTSVSKIGSISSYSIDIEDLYAANYALAYALYGIGSAVIGTGLLICQTIEKCLESKEK